MIDPDGVGSGAVASGSGLDRAGLAALYGKTTRTISLWAAEGAPVHDPAAMADWWSINRKHGIPARIREAAEKAGWKDGRSGRGGQVEGAGFVIGQAAGLEQELENARRWVSTCFRRLEEEAKIAGEVTSWEIRYSKALDVSRRLEKDVPAALIEAGLAWSREEALEEARVLFSQIDGDMKRRARTLDTEFRQQWLDAWEAQKTAWQKTRFAVDG